MNSPSWTAEVFQNEYLSEDGTDVHAIVTVSCAGAAIAGLVADGGTAMSGWLHLANELFGTVATDRRHAILLTDGRNESEPAEVLAAEVAACTDRFQCDCRGVGADWSVPELRGIATALLGTVELVADPAKLAADFTAMMQASMARGVADAKLKVWVPRGAQLLFVRQVAPTIEDLTDRRAAISELVTEYPTGAWGDGSRDYHVAVRVPPRAVGSEQLAARVQLEVAGASVAQGLVKAQWSDDGALTARIDPAVAHYTGQAELAGAIQEGLAAKQAGDDTTATNRLGRAAQLALETGDEAATNRLRKVVDIDDAATGRVRLRGDASRLDELDLDTSSVKTSRVRPPSGSA